VEAIAAEHAAAKEKAKWYKSRCDEASEKDEFDTFAGKVLEWQRKAKTLATELAKAQAEAASPLAESWGEFRSLAELLAKDRSDDLRLRARAALRRAVDSIHCLFIDRGRLRLAAVQVWFRGGDYHRQYLMGYLSGRSNQNVKRPGQCCIIPNLPPAPLERKQKETLEKWMDRLAKTSGGKVPVYDLRNPEETAQREKMLVKHFAAICDAK
jgi:hypothetical protein